MTRRQRGVSAFILGVLALQVGAVLHEVAGGRETLWPFLPWGMFRQATEPPVEAARIRIYAETTVGSRRVGDADAGFDRYAFRRHVRERIAAGDSVAARSLARRLADRWSTPVRAIAVESTRVTLQDGTARERTTVRRFPVEVP